MSESKTKDFNLEDLKEKFLSRAAEKKESELSQKSKKKRKRNKKKKDKSSSHSEEEEDFYSASELSDTSSVAEEPKTKVEIDGDNIVFHLPVETAKKFDLPEPKLIKTKMSHSWGSVAATALENAEKVSRDEATANKMGALDMKGGMDEKNLQGVDEALVKKTTAAGARIDKLALMERVLLLVGKSISSINKTIGEATVLMVGALFLVYEIFPNNTMRKKDLLEKTYNRTYVVGDAQVVFKWTSPVGKKDDKGEEMYVKDLSTIKEVDRQKRTLSAKRFFGLLSPHCRIIYQKAGIPTPLSQGMGLTTDWVAKYLTDLEPAMQKNMQLFIYGNIPFADIYPEMIIILLGGLMVILDPSFRSHWNNREIKRCQADWTKASGGTVYRTFYSQSNDKKVFYGKEDEILLLMTNKKTTAKSEPIKYTINTPEDAVNSCNQSLNRWLMVTGGTKEELKNLVFTAQKMAVLILEAFKAKSSLGISIEDFFGPAPAAPKPTKSTDKDDIPL